MSHDLGQNGKDFTYPIIFTKSLLQAISHTWVCSCYKTCKGSGNPTSQAQTITEGVDDQLNLEMQNYLKPKSRNSLLLKSFTQLYFSCCHYCELPWTWWLGHGLILSWQFKNCVHMHKQFFLKSWKRVQCGFYPIAQPPCQHAVLTSPMTFG
jgi:hypothetical protein